MPKLAVSVIVVANVTPALGTYVCAGGVAISALERGTDRKD